MTILLNNLFSLFILMLVGFSLIKLKILPASVTGYLTTILMKVGLPAMLFVSMIRPFDKSYLTDMLIMLVLSAAFLLFFMTVTIPIARFFGIKKEHTGIWEFAVSFSNNGFFGFPIVISVLGDAGLGLAVIYNISQNVLVYSLGLRQVRRGLPADPASAKFNWKRSLLTMINLSMLLGIICFVAEITPPEFLMTPLSALRDLCTPLSMILIGMHIGNGSFKETVKDRDAVIGTAAKLVVIPLIAWLLLKVIPLSNPMIAKVILLTVAMPGASVSGILAEECGGDSKLAARIVFFSTTLCFITIPLICLLP